MLLVPTCLKKALTSAQFRNYSATSGYRRHSATRSSLSGRWLRFTTGPILGRSESKGSLQRSICFEYIRMREYAIYPIIANMQDALRRFKADMFQALGHPTRIAIVELLGEGELSAGALIEKLGIEQANVSQHLAVLRTKQIVTNRKSGNQVFYSVRDPLITEVLALMRRYFQTHLKEALDMLDEMEKPAGKAG